jgi:hypothetical protein
VVFFTARITMRLSMLETRPRLRILSRRKSSKAEVFGDRLPVALWALREIYSEACSFERSAETVAVGSACKAISSSFVLYEGSLSR